MENLRKYRVFIVMIVSIGVYYLGVFAFGWPIHYVMLIYLALILIAGIIFKASVFSIFAMISYSRGKKGRAEKYFRLAIKHNAKNPSTYSMFATVLLHDANRPAEALEMAQKALSMNPDIGAAKNAKILISNCYWKMGEIGKAIETLEAMAAEYEYVNTSVLSSLGYLHIIAGDLAKGRHFTEKALEESPESASAWDNMGQIYMGEGDEEKAEESFLKALSYRSDLVDAAYLLGTLYEKAGKEELARDYFLQARGCRLTPFNTVSEEQVEKKYREYLDKEFKSEF